MPNSASTHIDQARLSSSNTSGLTSTRLINLSGVLLWREIRAGRINVIIAALLLAVTAATIISVFSNRLDSGMLHKSTELLGADLRVRSNQTIPPAFYEKAQSLDLRTTTTLEFPSVVSVGDESTLAAIKAVDRGYPLKGRVTISQNAFSAGSDAETGPPPGTVWLESRLLVLLNAQIGDEIEVGKSSFKITALITQESDRGGNFYSLSPRLMMHLSDIEGAGFVGGECDLAAQRLVIRQISECMHPIRHHSNHEPDVTNQCGHNHQRGSLGRSSGKAPHNQNQEPNNKMFHRRIQTGPAAVLLKFSVTIPRTVS